MKLMSEVASILYPGVRCVQSSTSKASNTFHFSIVPIAPEEVKLFLENDVL